MNEEYGQERQTVAPLRKKRTYNRVAELIVLFVIGVALGFAAKTQAAKTVTMGFSDYLLSQQQAGVYDINALKKTLAQQQESGEASQAAMPVTGAACGE